MHRDFSVDPPHMPSDFLRHREYLGPQLVCKWQIHPPAIGKKHDTVRRFHAVDLFNEGAVDGNL
jgi:hypothetical protein